MVLVQGNVPLLPSISVEPHPLPTLRAQSSSALSKDFEFLACAKDMGRVKDHILIHSNSINSVQTSFFESSNL